MFLGKLDFKDLYKFYEKAHIFVYTPIWPEGLPTGILEAGLMECSVISSPQGGIKEIIEDGKTGLMANNEKELYDKLELLINDEEKRVFLSKELNKKIHNDFIWDKTINKILNDLEGRK